MTRQILCGTAHGPKLISETVAQAQAAAARATTFLAADAIKLSAITAKVDTEQCVKCLTCVRSCPFEVPVFEPESMEVIIDDALCQGCGVCTAVCPRQTIGLSIYEDVQLLCKIDCLLEEMSYAEIALVVGCSLGTIRSRLHNAKKKLRELMGSSGQENDRVLKHPD